MENVFRVGFFSFFFCFLQPKTLRLRNEMKTLFCCVVLGETSCASRAELWKKCNIFVFQENNHLS